MTPTSDLRSARQAILAAASGNALEFYDFVTYAYFAIQIGHTFFPSTSGYFSLMGSLATFGVGFVARPIGAWAIGGYSDKYGRKKGMFLSLILMGLGIVTLACTPGYATIGIAAPILAVFARLTQGFALGGEVGAATTYMLEAVPPEKRGWAASWQNSSQMIAFTAGAIVAFVLSVTLNEAQLGAFGWRVALLIGTTIVPFALVMRRNLPEHPQHADAPPSEAEELTATRAGFVKIVILGMIMIGSSTSTFYVFLYMTTFAQNTLHLPTWVGMAGDLANNGAGMITAIIGGWLSDKVGRRPAMIVPQIAFAVLILPIFAWFLAVRSVFAFLAMNIVLSAVGTMPSSAVFTAVSEALPRRMRARAFALVYTIPVTTIGGSTQLVITWLLKVTGRPEVVGWFLTGLAVSALAAMLFMPETAPISLRRGKRAEAVPAQ